MILVALKMEKMCLYVTRFGRTHTKAEEMEEELVLWRGDRSMDALAVEIIECGDDEEADGYDGGKGVDIFGVGR